MIDPKEVTEFFDRLAPTWDAELVRSDRKIGIILDNARVRKGSSVLDVACGTGVLFPDYLSRGVAHVTAVDISPEMVRIARGKCSDPRIDIICGDVESENVGSGFDSIVIYNAFPHFPDPARLIAHLSSLLKRPEGRNTEGGVLTVAHGMSREKIDSHHKGSASRVSNGLMSAEDLAEIFSRYLKVTTVISNDEMYQVAGTV